MLQKQRAISDKTSEWVIVCDSVRETFSRKLRQCKWNVASLMKCSILEKEILWSQGGKRARTESLLRVSRPNLYIIYTYKYSYRFILAKKKIVINVAINAKKLISNAIVIGINWER